MINETMIRFGYPATLVADYKHWLVLLRPAQPTLGSLVLAAKSEATALSDLSPEAFAELHKVIGDVEAALAGVVDYARINYLMLMMVDPHVHYHVVPRYEGARSVSGIEVTDSGWPKLPALADAVALDEGQIASLVGWLRDAWPGGQRPD